VSSHSASLKPSAAKRGSRRRQLLACFGGRYLPCATAARIRKKAREMSEMIWRSVRAADVAGDVFLASLPTRLDQRPSGWRRELSAVRMRAALLAALDPEDEALEEIVNRGLDGVPSGKSAIGAIHDYIAQGVTDERE